MVTYRISEYCTLERGRSLDNSGSLNYSSPSFALPHSILSRYSVHLSVLYNPDFRTCFIPSISLSILAISTPLVLMTIQSTNAVFHPQSVHFNHLFFPPVTTISSTIITDSSPLISWDEPGIWGYICSPTPFYSHLPLLEIKVLLNEEYWTDYSRSIWLKVPRKKCIFGRGSIPRACRGKYRSLRRSVSEERGSNYCASWWFWISTLI